MSIQKILKGLLISFILIAVLAAGIFLFVLISDNGSIKFPVKHKAVFEDKSISNFPGLLQVKNSKILNPSGQIIILRGLMPPDPAKLHNENKFNKNLLVDIKATGTNVVRVPVHPENYYRDKDYIWRYLDPIVSWAGELGMYVIIDWHYIGNIDTGSGNQMPDIDISPREFTEQFWKQTAAYFKHVPNVLFEIFNEPAEIDSQVWVKNANEIVDIIRTQGAKQIIIVGGIEYSKNLSWVQSHPIDDNNIVYASHIYPAHNKIIWPSYFGETAKYYPVLITEWGFIDENRNNTNQSYLVGDEKTYGKPLMDFLSENGIGWVACWYDDDWEPEMFYKDFKSYTKYGQFVINKLKE